LVSREALDLPQRREMRLLCTAADEFIDAQLTKMPSQTVCQTPEPSLQENNRAPLHQIPPTNPSTSPLSPTPHLQHVLPGARNVRLLFQHTCSSPPTHTHTQAHTITDALRVSNSEYNGQRPGLWGAADEEDQRVGEHARGLRLLVTR